MTLPVDILKVFPRRLNGWRRAEVVAVERRGALT